MTDTEIINAFMACIGNNECQGKDCPYYKNSGGCARLLKNVSDLLNRQKAEIKRLKAKKELYLERWQESLDFAKQDRAEAIRELAELLKLTLESGHLYGSDAVKVRVDNLVKEMTEDSND